MNFKDKVKRVIFEDNHLIVVNKLPGELVQGDHTGKPTLGDWVKDYIKQKYNKPGNVFLGVVHRIDQPVSGLVIFARTSKALSRMNEYIRESKITKSYIAVCSGKLPNSSGQLRDFMVKDTKTNISKVVKNKNPNAKLAILDYHLIASFNGKHVLLINLHTGRSHQIRVQLSNIQLPILNDVKYQSTLNNNYDGIFLHSYKLAFTHPVTKDAINLLAPLPSYPLWNEIQLLL